MGSDRFFSFPVPASIIGWNAKQLRGRARKIWVPSGASYALTLCYRACDFSKLSPSPFPLPSREGDLETLSPGGRGEGEGEYESEISHLKLAHMRRSLGIRKKTVIATPLKNGGSNLYSRTMAGTKCGIAFPLNAGLTLLAMTSFLTRRSIFLDRGPLSR